MAIENERLARIEDKLDKLSEAVVSLARMEERMITLFSRMDNYEGRQTKLEGRVDRVEDELTSKGVSLALWEKLFWIVATAAISTGFWYLR